MRGLKTYFIGGTYHGYTQRAQIQNEVRQGSAPDARALHAPRAADRPRRRDSNRDGDLDTIAVDTTGNGDFNLYIGDQDANGVPDTVEFYDDGDDMPIAAYFGRAVEDRFIDLAGIIYARVLAKEFIASEMISAFKDFVARAEEEYEKVKAADDAESEEAKEDETAEAAELSKDAE